MIVPIAKALGITTDEFLGMKESKNTFDIQNGALWRNLKMVERLPKTDQKAILHYIKTIAKNREVDQTPSKS